MAKCVMKRLWQLKRLCKNLGGHAELDKESVVRKFRITGSDKKNDNVIHYNLDMMKGYTMDDKSLS